jgi:thymidylate synthase (FAD)
MKILKNKGAHDLIAVWPSPGTNEGAQQILERAGRTCYQSEKDEVTEDSAASFISKINKRGHYSVIEHGWRGYIIDEKDLRWVLSDKSIYEYFWPHTKFLFITERDDQVLVSANLETWRKLYTAGLLKFFSIEEDLEEFAPQIFTGDNRDKDCVEVTPIKDPNQLITDNERLTHIATTTVYNYNSRGFTHELVRHRVATFSQESTRYVNESDLLVTAPPHKENAELEGLFSNVMSIIENSYKILLDIGWNREDARQILPIGVVSQIVMSCNLEEKKWLFKKRTDISSHWEIRQTIGKELEFYKKKYPKLYGNFEFVGTKKDAPYYKDNDESN